MWAAIIKPVPRLVSTPFGNDHLGVGSFAGFVADEVVRNTPHAFSHFTFEASGGEQIVVDIQGGGGIKLLTGF